MLPFMLLGIFDPVWVPKILSLIFQFGSLLLTVIIMRRVVGRKPKCLWLIPALFLCLNTSFVVWGVSGLENPLFTFLILAGTLQAMRDIEGPSKGWRSGLLFAGIALTRPEGIGYGLLVGAVIFVRALNTAISNGGDFKGSGRFLAGFAAALVLPYAVFMGWRWSYFHDLVANPYYFKSNSDLSLAERFLWGSTGWRYVASALDAHKWLWFLCSAPGLVLVLRKPEAWIPLVIMAMSVVFPLFACGDWMMEFRFLSPFYPLFLILASSSIIRLVSILDGRRRLFAVVAVAMAGVTLVYHSAETSASRSFLCLNQPTVSFKQPENTASEVRRWADSLGLSHVMFATPDIGGSALYGSDNHVEVLDLGGLGDRLIGRYGMGSHFLDYILEVKKPEFIETHGMWAIQMGLQDDFRFNSDYQPVWRKRSAEQDRLAADSPHLMNGLYVRRELVNVDENLIAQHVEDNHGDVVAFQGLRGTIAENDGIRGRITLFFELLKNDDIPRMRLELLDRSGMPIFEHEVKLGDRCYKGKFGLVGDLVPSSIPISLEGHSASSVECRLTIESSLKPRTLRFDLPVISLSEACSRSTGSIIESLNAEQTRPAPGDLLLWRSVAGRIDSQRRHIGSLLEDLIRQRMEETRLNDTLAIIEFARNEYPGECASWLPKYSTEIANAYLKRVESKSENDDFWASIPDITASLKLATSAAPRRTDLLVKFLDLLPLAKALTRGTDCSIAYNLSPESDPVVQYWQSLATSPFPHHQVRLRDLRRRMADSEMPPLDCELVFGDGWSELESWGRWAYGKRCVIVAQPEILPANLRIEYSAWEAMSSPQSCRLLIDGEPAAEFKVTGDSWQFESVVVPLDPPIGKRYCVVIMEFDSEYRDDLPGNSIRTLPVGDVAIEYGSQ